MPSYEESRVSGGRGSGHNLGELKEWSVWNERGGE